MVTNTKFTHTVFDYFHRPPSPSLECKDASLARQEFVKDADINNIMQRYSQGVAPLPSGARPALYGDFSDVPDYQTALQIVIDARQRFDALPSNIRERFGNDPAQLLEFLNKPDNFDEGVKLGFFEPKKVVKDDQSVSVPEKGATE